MKIFDPLYGAFELSSLASRLVMAPEIRRLSQIRLLNSLTPSLATLGELRRFSHTLGVLHLFSLWKVRHAGEFSRGDLDALEAAILLHDVATPPFGHLFEYILKEKQGWDHEQASCELFLRHHAPENSGHQIFAGQTPKVYRLVQKLNIDHNAICEILKKNHQLHALIMGSVDFDNIDNVWRMAWSLGLDADIEDARQLASAISVSNKGDLVVPRSARGHLAKWADLRRAVYEILVFDPSTVAGQAVLTKAIRIAINEGLLSDESWTLTDEELLSELRKHSATKKLITQQYLGELPQSLMTVQLRWNESPLFKAPREEIENAILNSLTHFLKGNLLVYVFKEKGSFSKEITLFDEDGQEEKFGKTTRSLIVYLFGPEALCRQAERKSTAIVQNLLSTLQVDTNDILRITGNVSGIDKHGHSQLFS